MAFEIQPEGPPVSERSDLPLKITGECRFSNSQFTQQFVQS